MNGLESAVSGVPLSDPLVWPDLSHGQNLLHEAYIMALTNICVYS